MPNELCNESIIKVMTTLLESFAHDFSAWAISYIFEEGEQ